MGVIGVGTFWISARPLSLYISFVLLISSSSVEPLSPLEFHVAIPLFPAFFFSVFAHLTFQDPLKIIRQRRGKCLS